jgi:transcriptional regulator with XRE-family HTH domain
MRYDRLRPTDPHTVRRRAGLSQVSVAGRAGVSVSTVRIYEADPAAVSDRSREVLSAFYDALRREMVPAA